MLSVLFLLQSDTCLIDGQCYAANEAHPSASEVCLRCLPIVDDTDWTYGKHPPLSLLYSALRHSILKVLHRQLHSQQ